MDKSRWEYKKIKEVADVIGGSTPKTNVEEYWGGDNYWVTPAELDGSKYIEKTVRCITSNAVDKTNLTLMPSGTVLLSSRAPIGKVCITKAPMYCNQGFKNLICKELLYNEFAYYFLKHNVDYLQSLGTGATFKEISKKVVENVTIPVPPLSEQQHIVEELDLLSSIIEKKKAQLNELDNLAQSLFYEMFGDPITNEKGWEVKKLKEACTCITDGDHMPPPKVDKGIPFITISNIDKQNREIDFRDTFFVPQSYYDSINKERKAQIDDVLYTVTGSYGIPIIVKEDRNFCFQRHIALLRPNKHLVSPCYLCYWALCKSIKYLADDVATGIAQKTVGLSSLRKFPIIIPPLSLQQQFASKIEAIEHQKELIKQSIKEVETLFNSRMDYYFN